ncbi:hypothetical protein BT67DRAFT_385401 [Trichocladium antarcticum]|uniref:PhoD-like phosphatase domain-containing protein n=1 Tax=Trichocladium antarcticum TaxID=1450529 RepID=A0AAN6ZC82_9PEZI|nr:hypothetical protein BT67DRAFT_385401 [Trichocladium antarcticum]
MAAPPTDAPADGAYPADDREERNPYASSNRWRHAESSAYAKYEKTHGTGVARGADARGTGVSDLADFLNKSRIDPAETAAAADRPVTPRFKPVVAGASEARAARGDTDHPDGEMAPDGKEIVCGPLLNYRRMEGTRWVGSVLVVTAGGGRTQPIVPMLDLRRAGGGSRSSVQGFCLYSDRRNTFWRFDLEVEMAAVEARWEYELPELRLASSTKPRVNSFFVPAVDQAMRIMFHSCNGFSVGTDEDAWSGPALWNDVVRRHNATPFHVMIGGGDQIYNDGIRVSGPLRPWTDIANPKKRRHHPFPESLRLKCDDYYLKNYIRWYATEPFATANGQIAQLNIWDDHDIIDGFGSYVNDFMKCDVFRGIGGTAHKYYVLFQHHLPPPPSTYTSDAVPASTQDEGQGIDPNQAMNTYVHPRITESGYIYGLQPGPYVAEPSLNMYAQLGARIGFLGIDARTERTRHQVNYPDTYSEIFARLKQELSDAGRAGRPLRHLILLLGIPIAYPRLTWLENIFSSPIVGPIKMLNRRVGFGGSFFNSFDGSIDLLDDLDDHYTARTHKKERNWLVEKLQGICAEFSIRVTILGGDVHLAALGRFYSNPKLDIPAEHDFRYMVNVVSSAIVNKPPPAAVANLLARRNKIHHLNRDTSETLLKLFDKDPGHTPKTAAHNRVTMPSRNFTVITENPAFPSAIPPPTIPTTTPLPGRKDGRLPLTQGELNCGTQHRAATATATATSTLPAPRDGSLDVCICVEADQHDRAGKTEGYGLTIPPLDYRGPRPASPDALRLRLGSAARSVRSVRSLRSLRSGSGRTGSRGSAGVVRG